MKTNILKIGSILLAVFIFGWSQKLSAQVAVTQTTTTNAGTITEFVPDSQTLILKTETSPAPLRYSVTKETTFVDETGAPVVVEKVARGIPVAVEFTRAGDRLVASRVVVKKTTVVPEEVTTTRTTTTTTRELTREEKEKLEKTRHEEKERSEGGLLKKLRDRD